MFATLSNIKFIILILIMFTACKNERIEVIKKAIVLEKGIYEIVDSDSGKVQTQNLHSIARRME